ncbi:MAG: hypothetical protein EP299_01795 [Acidobacteria bacterium]|nr:MAG: hypothetical protein EP299_01795 [Acidobacteriota bacterium]
MTTKTFERGDHVQVKGFPGVAFWFVGYAERRVLDPWDPLQDTYDIDHSTAVVRAVGDDLDREIDMDRLEPLDRDAFCGGCGQIGCGHG